jgi:hypothetical protein
MPTDNFCFYLQNRLLQTSQTGGPPLVFPVIPYDSHAMGRFSTGVKGSSLFPPRCELRFKEVPIILQRQPWLDHFFLLKPT